MNVKLIKLYPLSQTVYVTHYCPLMVSGASSKRFYFPIRRCTDIDGFWCCNACRCPLTVKHFLIQWTDFNDICIKYFVTSTMRDLFEHVSMRNVVNFIKETRFYHLIYCCWFITLTDLESWSYNHFCPCGLRELWFFVRLGPICFLAGCRKRRLNQG